MAFVKRNLPVRRSPAQSEQSAPGTDTQSPTQPVPGLRPSPLTGQPTTSTGTATLDNLLGGHAGLPLGSLLLIEESGTTDFAGALLRFYAAQGITHGQTLHVYGVGEAWVRQLPGLVGAADAASDVAPVKVKVDEEKMKIAWRYERLGQHDAGRSGRGALVVSVVDSAYFTGAVVKICADSIVNIVAPNREHPPDKPDGSIDGAANRLEAFSHTFDLAKRLSIPPTADINHIPINLTASPATSPFTSLIEHLSNALQTSNPSSVHRLVMPTILSPALYPPSAGHPHRLLQFLHSLRSLLRQHPTRLTVMASLPTELYPRSTGLVRWAEHLSDGVIELTPFPHLMDASNSLAESGGSRAGDDQPQGMLKLHKIPVMTERGGGGAGTGVGDDLAFTLSRRKFVIRPFSLPPMEGDTEAQNGQAGGEGALGKASKADIEF